MFFKEAYAIELMSNTLQWPKPVSENSTFHVSADVGAEMEVAPVDAEEVVASAIHDWFDHVEDMSTQMQSVPSPQSLPKARSRPNYAEWVELASRLGRKSSSAGE